MWAASGGSQTLSSSFCLSDCSKGKNVATSRDKAQKNMQDAVTLFNSGRQQIVASEYK